MKTNLTLLAIIATVAATLLLSGCGGGGSDGTDENGMCRVDNKLVPREQCK